MNDSRLRLAILDMNNNVPNRGLYCIKQLADTYQHALSYEVFDVRHKCELPDDSFDIYISSGGPGSPLEGDGVWDQQWFDLVQQLYIYNQYASRKKYVFFICHSFQMACRHFHIGELTYRTYMSFGTYPVYKTEDGEQEPLFSGLPDPFYIADFRHWQVVHAKKDALEQIGAKIIAVEQLTKLPTRAVMAVRFTPEMIGTQFHPEADALGMLDYFQQEERKKQILLEHGEDVYRQMIKDLYAPQRIDLTQRTILPNFLNHCIAQLRAVPEPAWIA